MSANQVPVIPVRMIHTGEVINVWTKYGANEFLKQCRNKDDFKFFSSDMKKADVIRKKGKKKGKLNNADRSSLRLIYEKLTVIVTFGDVAPFQEGVPDAESTAWLNHAAAIFQELSKDPHWIRTGTMLRHDEMLFASCSHLLNFPGPVLKVFQDNSFFESISALILARKDARLDPTFALHFVRMVGETFACTYDLERCDNPWPPEKTFKKLEASGVLEHYMLCVAVKQPPHEQTETRKNLTLDHLVKCVAFIKKRFKVGTPCGDTVRTILDGHMEVCPIALPYLQSLLKLSGTFEELKTSGSGVEVCRNCCKMGERQKYMQCSKCRNASYCSKECQRAHWKQHKPVCYPEKKILNKNSEASEKILIGFSWTSFVDIMKAMVEESEKAGGLKMREMILEVDFRPDRDGNVPILQEPPQFKIFPNAKYLEADVESGFYSEEELQEFATLLHNRPPCSDLLCCTLSSGRKKSCRVFNK